MEYAISILHQFLPVPIAFFLHTYNAMFFSQEVAGEQKTNHIRNPMLLSLTSFTDQTPANSLINVCHLKVCLYLDYLKAPLTSLFEGFDTFVIPPFNRPLFNMISIQLGGISDFFYHSNTILYFQKQFCFYACLSLA